MIKKEIKVISTHTTKNNHHYDFVTCCCMQYATFLYAFTCRYNICVSVYHFLKIKMVG